MHIFMTKKSISEVRFTMKCTRNLQILRIHHNLTAMKLCQCQNESNAVATNASIEVLFEIKVTDSKQDQGNIGINTF